MFVRFLVFYRLSWVDIWSRSIFGFMLSHLIIWSWGNFLWSFSDWWFMIILGCIVLRCVDACSLCLLPYWTYIILLVFCDWLLRYESHQLQSPRLQIPNPFIHKILIIELINFFNPLFDLRYSYNLHLISKLTFFIYYKYPLLIFSSWSIQISIKLSRFAYRLRAHYRVWVETN